MSPNFTFCQGSEKPGRRSFAERSRCIKARLRRASFSISRACFSIASSHTPNTSAIFCCSANGGNGKRNFFKSLPFMEFMVAPKFLNIYLRYSSVL